MNARELLATFQNYLAQGPAYQVAAITNASASAAHHLSPKEAEAFIGNLIEQHPDAYAAWVAQTRRQLETAGVFEVNPLDQALWQGDQELWQYAQEHNLFP